MIRVLLADDHDLVVTGLCKLLDESGDLVVVATVRDGRDALHAALGDDPPWDVLVLDLSLPHLSGFEVLRRLLGVRPDARVVIVTMYAEDQYAASLLNLGALAFVSKTQPAEDLVTAIRAAAEGRRYCSPTTDRRLSMAYEDDRDLPHKSLTSREHQVFMLLIEGQQTADIAAELNLSLSTVSNHLAAIRTKLGARNLFEVVNYAHRVGLVG